MALRISIVAAVAIAAGNLLDLTMGQASAHTSTTTVVRHSPTTKSHPTTSTAPQHVIDQPNLDAP